MVVITKANVPQSPEALAKGQVWRLENIYIQIVELGSRLLHYRMLNFPGQKGVRVQTSSISVMLEYLRSRHAKLLKGSVASLT